MGKKGGKRDIGCRLKTIRKNGEGEQRASTFAKAMADRMADRERNKIANHSSSLIYTNGH